jgi:hypothetical protein
MIIGAGIAISPITGASAVHDTIQTNSIKQLTLTVTGMDADNTAALEGVSWLIPQPFELLAVTATVVGPDTSSDCDLGAAVIRTDMIAEGAYAEDDPAAINAVNDERLLMDATAANPRVVGDEILSIDLVEGGGDCDAGTLVTLNAVIETTGALTTAPTGTKANPIATKTSNLAGD